MFDRKASAEMSPKKSSDILQKKKSDKKYSFKWINNIPTTYFEKLSMHIWNALYPIHIDFSYCIDKKTSNYVIQNQVPLTFKIYV